MLSSALNNSDVQISPDLRLKLRTAKYAASLSDLGIRLPKGGLQREQVSTLGYLPRGFLSCAAKYAASHLRFGHSNSKGWLARGTGLQIEGPLVCNLPWGFLSRAAKCSASPLRFGHAVAKGWVAKGTGLLIEGSLVFESPRFF